ncbi:MAG TPA: sensor domain-containing diguanylate cyclase [Anaerolineales bacterium]|nr:sensor domain-containing diguanylate cyclase [Anaerolineales bacterium]
MNEAIIAEIAALRLRAAALGSRSMSIEQLEDFTQAAFSQLLSLVEQVSSRQQGSPRASPLDTQAIHDLKAILTTIQEAQRHLRENEVRYRELGALHAATETLLTTIDMEALLARILDAATLAIPVAEKGMIHLIAQDTGQLEMRASFGYTDPRIRRFKLPGSVGYVAQAVGERTPLKIDDLESYTSSAQSSAPAPGGALSAIIAPLVLKSQVIGALSLESSRAAAFSDNDLSLLVNFASTATAAIRNSREHAEVQKLAVTDTLTGLYNRRGFIELGQREVERARRYKRPIVAIVMDLDNFKEINDNYGHANGDMVLQIVANRCLQNLRRVDLVGRLGGDEFTILLPETDDSTGSQVAERLRNSIANTPVDIDGAPVAISVSVGVSRSTTSIPDLDILLGRADSAMYLAKKAGRNRLEVG